MPSRSWSGVRLEVRRSPSDTRFGRSNGERAADVGGERALDLGGVGGHLRTRRLIRILAGDRAVPRRRFRLFPPPKYAAERWISDDPCALLEDGEG